MRCLVAILICAIASTTAADSEPLPGTKALTWPETDGALADRLMDGAHKFVERAINQSKSKRGGYWDYDFSSDEAYEESFAPNRERFKRMIGVIDEERVDADTMERFGDDQNPALVAETEMLRFYQVRWPVLDGLFSEGLLVWKITVCPFVRAISINGRAKSLPRISPAAS